MPTAAERLLELSPLVGTHTATQHLLAVQIGSGTTQIFDEFIVTQDSEIPISLLDNETVNIIEDYTITHGEEYTIVLDESYIVETNE